MAHGEAARCRDNPPWERWVGAVAVALLLGLIVVLYARGFLTLAADELAKAKTAWQTLRYPAAGFERVLFGRLVKIALLIVPMHDLPRWIVTRHLEIERDRD